MRGGKFLSLVIRFMLNQLRIGDVVPLEIVPSGELSGGSSELKMASRTPSEILQPKEEF